MTKFKNKVLFTLLMIGMILLIPSSLLARNYIEVSLGGNFTRSNYTEDSYTWQRKMGGSLGYYLFDLSQLEISFQDVTNRTNIKDYENTTFHDRVFAFNWVQQFLPKSSYIQPYAKAGIGQLYRESSGTYGSGASPVSEVGAVTGILGGGLKLYFTQTFAVKLDVTSYLTGGRIGSWQDNYSITYGISYLF